MATSRPGAPTYSKMRLKFTMGVKYLDSMSVGNFDNAMRPFSDNFRSARSAVSLYWQTR